MKLKKYYVLLFFCFCIILTIVITVSIAKKDDLIINYNIKILQNNDRYGADLKALKYKERVYVPIGDFLGEAGIFAEYNDTDQVVMLKSENSLLIRANLVLHYIKYKDLERLSKLVHPAKGVTFSPHAYVDETCLNFSANELAEKLSDDKVYVWGSAGATGDPIEAIFSDYFARLYSKDFINADKIGNNTIIQSGNGINTIPEVYPNGKFIEYNFQSSIIDDNGVDWTSDWQSLRLVFEVIDNEWYLVAIVEDQWET